MSGRWRWATAAAPLVASAPVVIILLTEQRLPDPVAVHFDITGSADVLVARPVAALITVLIGLAVGGAYWFLLSPRVDAGPPVPMHGVLWGVAALVGVVVTAGTTASIGLVDGGAARLPLWTLPVALAVAGAVGAVVTRIAPRPPAAADEQDAVPAASIGPNERISWSQRAGTRWLSAAGLVLLGAGVASTAWVNPATGLGIAVGGLGLLTFGSARTTVDRRGLTVAFGPVGWPRLRVPTADIADAGVTDASPLRYGGWGYRIVPRGTAVLFRAGPALIVHRRNGRWLIVSVDAPETAAELLNGLVQQR